MSLDPCTCTDPQCARHKGLVRDGKGSWRRPGPVGSEKQRARSLEAAYNAENFRAARAEAILAMIEGTLCDPGSEQQKEADRILGVIHQRAGKGEDYRQRRDDAIYAATTKAHEENRGGGHRTGFCEACADFYTVVCHAFTEFGAFGPLSSQRAGEGEGGSCPDCVAGKTNDVQDGVPVIEMCRTCHGSGRRQ